MSVDTHKAVKTLTGAGFSETQAEALIETMGDSRDALATKADVQELAHTTSADIQDLAHTTSADIQDLARATKADIQDLARATKADIQDLARATAADIATVRADFKTELKDLELRLEQRLNRQTIQLAGSAIAAGGVVVAILKWFP
jgi:gas vesicle protein